MNHGETRTLHEEKGARFVSNLRPYLLHRFRVPQEQLGPAAQIHDETQVVIGKHPLNDGMLPDLPNLSAVGGG